jgi:hypothetical protein
MLAGRCATTSKAASNVKIPIAARLMNCILDRISCGYVNLCVRCIFPGEDIIIRPTDDVCIFSQIMVPIWAIRNLIPKAKGIPYRHLFKLSPNYVKDVLTHLDSASQPKFLMNGPMIGWLSLG